MKYVGTFAVTGWYTNLVPTCSVLPMTEFGAARERFQFSGFIDVSPEGRFSGSIDDVTGPADVCGNFEDGVLMMTKTYRDGVMREHPIYYRMVPVEGRPLAFTGGYRFSEDHKNDDGSAEMHLSACPA